MNVLCTAMPMALSALVLLASTSPIQITPPPIWGLLKSGPYAVGFTVTRAGNAVAVWYPASGGGTAMTLADHYAANELRGYGGFLRSAGISSSAVDAMFGAAMAARRGATPRAGRFPVVLIGQGNAQGAADQAVLAEYLASRGYVVASTPSPMSTTPMTREDEVGPFAERQARELSDALKVLAGWPSADASRVGVIGHSFGARAALLLAMIETRVAAVVSLDGGIGTATAVTSFRKAPAFDAAKAVAPILHFYERLDAFMAPDFTLLQSLPARLRTEPTEDLHHVHFTTLGFAAALIPEVAAATGAGVNAGNSLRLVAEGTAEFLRTHLSAAR
jgi:dienelactone hydrolase